MIGNRGSQPQFRLFHLRDESCAAVEPVAAPQTEVAVR